MNIWPKMDRSNIFFHIFQHLTTWIAYLDRLIITWFTPFLACGWFRYAHNSKTNSQIQTKICTHVTNDTNRQILQFDNIQSVNEWIRKLFHFFRNGITFWVCRNPCLRDPLPNFDWGWGYFGILLLRPISKRSNIKFCNCSIVQNCCSRSKVTRF